MRNLFGGIVILTEGEVRLLEQLKTIDRRLSAMQLKMGTIMTKLDDLNAAVDKISTAVTNASNEIKDLATKIGDNSDDTDAVEAAASRISTLADNLQGAVDAAVAPVQTPTPAPANNSNSTPPTDNAG